LGVAPPSAGAPGASPATPATSSLVENFRGEIDQFFYTIIYAIIVYMIGMASFKMVDLIPDTILKWMSKSITSFGEAEKDPASGLVQYSLMGTQTIMGQLQGGFSSIGNLFLNNSR
jgi:hypothetical protein